MSDERDKLLRVLDGIDDARIVLWSFQYMADVTKEKIVAAQDRVIRVERFPDSGEGAQRAFVHLDQMRQANQFAEAFLGLIRSLVLEEKLKSSLMPAIKKIK